MITPSHKVRIFVASDPVDFRKGHDGLAALVQSHLRQKPFDGSVYVFRAKRADRLKLIYWDGSGLKNGVMRLEPAQFEALFAGLDWRRVRPLEVAAPAAAE